MQRDDESPAMAKRAVLKPMPVDDDGDEVPSRRRRGFSPLIAGAIGAAVGLAAGGGCGLVVGLGAGMNLDTAAAKASPSTSPVADTLTKDEFVSKVKGKTKEEVLAAVGKPDKTADMGIGGMSWHYVRPIRDPVTKTTYGAAYLFFGPDGRVTKVDM